MDYYPIILAAQLLRLEGEKSGRVVTPITFACVPLRPVIPCHVCVDFEITGVEKQIPGEGNLADTVISVSKKWPKDGVIPAACFSEVATMSRLNLPGFAVGDELVLLVKNLHKGPGVRVFTCAWLVYEKGS